MNKNVESVVLNYPILSNVIVQSMFGGEAFGFLTLFLYSSCSQAFIHVPEPLMRLETTFCNSPLLMLE